MAGGTAGAPDSGATGQATAQGMPSQASQYSNYGAQQSYQPQYQQPYQPQYQQAYQPQYGQGYGSPFGGMGGGYGYQETPQYGYGGMGNQFMGGGMYGPRGGFGGYGGERGFGRGGFDPRMAMQQMYGQQAAAQPTATEAQPAVQAQPEIEQHRGFGGFRGPRRGFGGYGGGFDPRMMRGGFGGYDY